MHYLRKIVLNHMCQCFNSNLIQGKLGRIYIKDLTTKEKYYTTAERHN